MDNNTKEQLFWAKEIHQTKSCKHQIYKASVSLMFEKEILSTIKYKIYSDLCEKQSFRPKKLIPDVNNEN